MMATNNSLLNAFKKTKYPVAGHGSRNVQVMKQALEEVDGQLASDMYGQGAVIEEFQNKMASYLGKEAAVFFPSGTMAQQIALRIWCDGKGVKKVAYHPLCHLEIHEQHGLRELHQIESVLLAEKDRLITLDDIVNMEEYVSVVLLELPQREIGGQLPDYQTIVDISAFCREKGIKLHLDGARLFEIVPYYQKSAAEICALFDSVYVSFYKGIGGIAGAILASDDADFIKESIVWKRRHGGDLISLYPYVLSADYYFDKRIGKMNQYFEQAKELAVYFNQCPGVCTLPRDPVSNMFHVHFGLAKETVEPILVEIYEAAGVGLTGSLKAIDDTLCSFELSIGDAYESVPKQDLQAAFAMLASRLTGVAQ